MKRDGEEGKLNLVFYNRVFLNLCNFQWNCLFMCGNILFNCVYLGYLGPDLLNRAN